MPEVGVVLTTYNTGRFVEETLRSVLSQTLKDWSLVVVDDGSTDESAAIAERTLANEPRARVLRSKNQGVANARNLGFQQLPELVHSVAFLDSDDVWEPDALETLAGQLTGVAVAGYAAYIGPSGEPVTDPNDPLLVISERDAWRRPTDPREWALQRPVLEAGGKLGSLPYPEPTSTASLLADNRILTPGLALVDAEAFRRAGGFRQEYSPCDDWELWLRLSAQGSIGVLDRRVLRYRLRGDNESLNMARSRLAHDRLSAMINHWPWLVQNRPDLLDAWRRRYRAQKRGEAGHRLRVVRARLRRGRLLDAARQLLPLHRSLWRALTGP